MQVKQSMRFIFKKKIYSSNVHYSDNLDNFHASKLRMRSWKEMMNTLCIVSHQHIVQYTLAIGLLSEHLKTIKAN